jgi:hypothetical protein
MATLLVTVERVSTMEGINSRLDECRQPLLTQSPASARVIDARRQASRYTTSIEHTELAPVAPGATCISPLRDRTQRRDVEEMFGEAGVATVLNIQKLLFYLLSLSRP